MKRYNPEEIPVLAQKWFEGTITEDEKLIFNDWYNKHDINQYNLAESYTSNSEMLKEDIRQKIKANIPEFKRKTILLRPAFLRVAVSVAAVFLIVVSSVLWFSTDIFSPLSETANQSENIVPGGEQAILTLANGKQINLNQQISGDLASASGISITKTSKGILTYKITEPKNAAQAKGSNTISTPHGGKWQVLLPDGSKVWLNSASSITFPVSFTSYRERSINLKGEAYFEVAKNKKLPFRVYSSGQVVTVLGTHFNVKSYPEDGQARTTLLEGSVGLKAIGASKLSQTIIRPGYDASFNGSDFIVQKADIEAAVAWKEGKFIFHGENITEIMKNISRWYNVEVIYEEPVTQEEFHAKISREKNLKDVLKVLESTDAVHFKVEGRRIMVRK